jgi:hypothetical protein
MVNNYYRPGPETNPNVKERIVNPSKAKNLPYGKFYVQGNVVDGAPAVTKNNYLGIQIEKDATEQDKLSTVANEPFAVVTIPDQTATAAFSEVLTKVGASFQRDTMDLRILREVVERKGRIIDVQGSFPRSFDFEKTITAWPTLKMGPIVLDTDKDGMPDDWEKQHGLNPNNATDGNLYTLNADYTNIEWYLNSLIQ